jgi:hypothetical protein
MRNLLSATGGLDERFASTNGRAIEARDHLLLNVSGHLDEAVSVFDLDTSQVGLRNSRAIQSVF